MESQHRVGGPCAHVRPHLKYFQSSHCSPLNVTFHMREKDFMSQPNPNPGWISQISVIFLLCIVCFYLATQSHTSVNLNFPGWQLVQLTHLGEQPPFLCLRIIPDLLQRRCSCNKSVNDIVWAIMFISDANIILTKLVRNKKHKTFQGEKSVALYITAW